MTTAERLQDEVLAPIITGPVWTRGNDGKFILPEVTIGWEMLGWTAEYLRQPDGPDAGDPWRFTDEQARFILWWYAIDPQTKRFVYRKGTLRRCKGWGKDPAIAALSLNEFVGPCRFDGFDARGEPVAKPHPAAWVQIAAVSREQTKNTMTLFPGMMSDALVADYGIDPGKEIIYAHRGASRIEAVTSSPRSLEGGRMTFGVGNETHHWLANNDGHDMAKVMARNAGKSRDGSSRQLAITNGHLPGEDSVAEREYLAIETGGLAEDVLYDAIEAPEGLDAADKEDVKRGIIACRGDSWWINADRVAADFLDRTVTTEAEAMRFYWNRIEGGDAAYMDMEAWRGASVFDPKQRPKHGERIAMGFDGSIKDDSTALIGCRLSDGFLFPIKLWERPSGPAGNSWTVPRTEVDEEVRNSFRDYDIVRFYWDPPYWQDYGDKWSGDFGDEIVLEYWTMSLLRMSKALERLHSAAIAGELMHDGDERVARQVANAIVVKRGLNIAINKRSPQAKIDACVATAIAYEARNDAVADGALNQAEGGFFGFDNIDKTMPLAEAEENVFYPVTHSDNLFGFGAA